MPAEVDEVCAGLAGTIEELCDLSASLLAPRFAAFSSLLPAGLDAFVPAGMEAIVSSQPRRG